MLSHAHILSRLAPCSALLCKLNSIPFYLGATALSIMTFNITTLSIIGLKVPFSITTLCHYVECRYAGCQILFFVMLNGIMLNAIMLNAIMLNAIMLNAIMLNAIMLNAIMLNAIMLNVIIGAFI